MRRHPPAGPAGAALDQQTGPGRAAAGPGQAGGPAGARDRLRRLAGRLRPADALLPASVALWAVGVSQINTAALGQWGLPAIAPVTFWAGTGLLVISAGLQLARTAPSAARLGAHAVALVVMLYGTAPLVYSQGRYAWLYKTVGVVQYISVHGRLDRHIDIYQNWPGFFALASWLGKVAGIASPLSYAKWAQLVFELAALPLLRLIYQALRLSTRQQWIALLLYPAANWIAQDYFSPQALGTLLSLAIIAVALRWLGGPRAPAPPAGRRLPFIVLVIGLYWVLTTAHELSPYILAVQLCVLAAASWLKPRWLPLVLTAIAVGYLLPRMGYVSAHYGLLNSFGSFFSNVAPPSFRGGAVPFSETMIRHAARYLSLAVWLLAVAGAWLRRRAGQPWLALLLLTFSPVLVLAGQAYGDEGILRVYLFSLPWAAALAAAALAPLRRSEQAGGRPRRRFADALLAPAGLICALALFFPAFFGDDSSNVMTTAEVAAVTGFLRTARPGPVYSAVANAPLSDTYRYSLFPLPTIFGAGGVAAARPLAPDIAGIIARHAWASTDGRGPAYVLDTPSMVSYSRALGIEPPASIARMIAALARSPDWKLVTRQGSTVIFQLRAGSQGGSG
ncbi:MAG: hypothetical protein ACLP52_18025 [Streptosporangiaceae bacterium]